MGVGYVTLGSNGYVQTPDAAALDITGDIDLRVEVALNAYTGSGQTLLAKFFGNRSYRLLVQSDSKLSLTTSPDGVAELGATSNAFSLAAGARTWFRATLDADNGASGRTARFYTSADGVTWTEIGTTTLAGTTSIFNSDRPVRLGAHSGLTPGAFAPGRYYRAEVRNGIDGPIVALPDFTGLSSGATSHTDAQGRVWTFANTYTVTPDIPPDTTPPTVSLLTETPREYDALAGMVTLQATASDAVGVSWVEFLVDDVLVGTDEVGTAGEYSVEWDTTTAANGDHVLTARALDAAGNTGTATRTIKVNASGWWVVAPDGSPRPASLKVEA